MSLTNTRACAKTAVVVLAVIAFQTSRVQGHGRLVEPPSRSSMWRFGYPNPINYNDNELFCGGSGHQWGKNIQGRCGVCGDPWDGKRENEAGGRYANGIIARSYDQGQIITINVDLTANHKGYFEFRLCPHNNIHVPVSQACLDEHPLRLVSGSNRYYVTSARVGIYPMAVLLPADVTCSQCVIQWKYNTGNSWGCADGECCLGCGAQEQFYGCADVSIVATGSPESTGVTASVAPGSKETDVTDGSEETGVTDGGEETGVTDGGEETGVTDGGEETGVTDGSEETGVTDGSEETGVTDGSEETGVTNGSEGWNGEDTQCKAVGAWARMPRIDVWCRNNCRMGYCPADYCSIGCRRLAFLAR